MQTNTSITRSVLTWLQVILFSSLILYWGKMLFIPLFFGLLIAIVMYPVCKWLETHNLNKTMAITVCLLIVTLVIAALLALLVWQLKVFSKDAPLLLNRLESTLQDFHQWLNENTRINMNLQDTGNEKITAALGNLLQSGFQGTVNTLFIMFLTPVYTALFMYHRRILVQYLKLVTPGRYQHQLDMILKQTIHTYFNYIKGMTLVYLIVGILNSIGLLALGVNHAILFGMLCAIMTIIPYIGIFISAMLPISVIWLETGNVWYPFGVVAVFSFVQ
jgi:predicted PurR-regulated permease PerM